MRDSMTALEISDTDQFGEKKKKNKQKSVIGVCNNNQITQEKILKEIVPEAMI